MSEEEKNIPEEIPEDTESKGDYNADGIQVLEGL